MGKPDLAYTQLRSTIQDLEATFLPAPVIARTIASMGKAEVLQVGAYVVLAHGAFEEYFETLALCGLEAAVDGWNKLKQHPSVPTLLLHLGTVSTVSDDTPDETAFNRVRLALEDLKRSFSRFIKTDNHGISERHLKRLFFPLGIDLPSDPRLSGSLTTFAGLRGDAAHTAVRGAKNQRDPSGTKAIVADCLDLAKEMKDRVVAIM